jgi:hypothetical protein
MATNYRPLFVRIRGLARRPRTYANFGHGYTCDGHSPRPDCDCGDCMRFRAIQKIASLAISHIDGKKPKKRKRAKR